MRAFITGGAGCIGSDLAARLAQDGHSVVVYDNFSTGKKEHLSGIKAQVIEGDILDKKLLARSMKGCDAVFHLAAKSTAKPSDSAAEDVETNVLGTSNVLEVVRTNGIRKIIFTSSQAVYGHSKTTLTEDTPLRPASMYAATKAAAEEIISGFSSVYGIDAWIFRLANVASGKSRRAGTSVVPDFIRKLRRNKKELEILGDGRQTKSYISVEDSIEAMLFCLRKGRPGVYNVASSDVISVNDLAKIVAEEMKLPNVKFRYTGGRTGWPGDVYYTVLDTGKIRALGWEPRHNSAEAVRISASSLLEVVA